MANRTLNRVTILGNIVSDIRLSRTTDGTSVCNVIVATDRTWKTADGQTKEEVQFHRVVAWNKLAELFSDLLKKGNKIYLEGRLQTRTFTDATGMEKTSTEIVAEKMILLDGKYFGEEREIIGEEKKGEREDKGDLNEEKQPPTI